MMSFHQVSALGRSLDSDESWPTKTAVDAVGNQYIVGSFTGTVRFGNLQLVSAGRWDIFIAKRSATGQYLWAVRGGGTGTDHAYGLAVSAQGNVFVAGDFEDVAAFGAVTKTSAGESDVYVAKLDGAGNFLWVTTGGGPAADGATAAAVDAQENVVVTGFFTGMDVAMGPVQLPTGTNGDILVAKLSPAGTVLWAESGGGPNTLPQVGTDVALDAAGNAFVTGTIYGPTTFSWTLGIHLDDPHHEPLAFVAKISAAGVWQWAVRSAGGATPNAGTSTGAAIAVDGIGDIVTTGSFTGTASFFGSGSLSSAGSNDIFVAKLTPAGTVVWAVRAGGRGYDFSVGLAVASGGTAYLTGSFTATAAFGPYSVTCPGTNGTFVARLSGSGVFEHALGNENPWYGRGTSLAFDRANGLHVVGFFTGPTAQFGSSILTGSSNSSTPTGYASQVSLLQPTAATTGHPTGVALQVWPNPGDGAFFISGPKVSERVVVYTVTGRLVYSSAVPPSGRLPLHLPAGLYWVRSGGSSVRLVVK